MTNEQKQKSYEDYLDSRKPFNEPVLTFEQFIESITADDCDNCKKCGETTCGNDINMRCFEPIQ